MFDMKCAVFLCLSLYILEAYAGAVSFIDPCPWNDAKCLLESSKKALPFFVKGLPEFEIPSMDPLVLKDLNGDNGELKLKFQHLIIKGLPNCVLKKVERSVKLKVELEMDCPIAASGKYNLNGTLYLLQVFGEGDFEIHTKNIKLSASVVLKPIKKDGKDYYKFASFDYKYVPVEVIHYDLKNLFNGDETKAEPVRAIMKENWKELIQDVGKPVIKEMMTQVVHEVGKFFLKVPANELEKD